MNVSLGILVDEQFGLKMKVLNGVRHVQEQPPPPPPYGDEPRGEKAENNEEERRPRTEKLLNIHGHCIFRKGRQRQRNGQFPIIFFLLNRLLL